MRGRQDGRAVCCWIVVILLRFVTEQVQVYEKGVMVIGRYCG